MLELKGVTIPQFPIVGLELVRELEGYDGPLLAHFRHRRQHDHYLYYWCDCDENSNRWMVLRVNETNIIRLVNRFVPLDLVIPKSCQDDFVYFVDMDETSKHNKVTWLPLQAIPEEYTPSQGTFLAGAIADPSYYSVLIENDLNIEQLGAFPRIFSLAYGFLYNLIILKSAGLRSHPWRGGFSALHFIDDLMGYIPTEDYPKVQTLQHSSPGFIRFRLDVSTAIQVGNLVATVTENEKDVMSAHHALAIYIRSNKLNEDIPYADAAWDQHKENLMMHTKALMVQIGVPMPDEFIASARRPFEAAKMALWFLKRLRKLAAMQANRLVRFPNFSPIDSFSE